MAEAAESVAKKASAKKSTAKRVGRKRAKKARGPVKAMDSATHAVASELAGVFTARLTEAGFSVSVRESKNKDALMATARNEKSRVSMRIGQR